MSDMVIVAMITAGAGLMSSVLTGYITSSKTIYRIDQLEKKVDKHNGLVERMVVVEQSTKSAHHRIEDLKKELGV